MKKNKIKIQNHNMRASFAPETFNESDLSVEIVWTTGAKVKRWSWSEGAYFEELSLKKDAVNLERLNSGAPLLNNHSSRSLSDNIGVVEKAWIKNKEGRALVRFSDREEVKGIVQDVKNGILRNISVGYSVERYEDVTKKDEETKTFRAVEWSPAELSIVNIPADHKAQVRSQENENDNEENAYNVEIIRQEDSMKTKDKEETQETPTPEQTRSTETIKKDLTEAEQTGVDKEMKRQSDIRSLCTSLKLEDEVTKRFIDEKKNIDEVNSEVVRLMAEKNKTSKTNSQTSVEVDDVSNKNKRRELTINALEHAHHDIDSDRKKPALIDGAREFMGGDVIEIARRFMESEGINTRDLSRQDIAKLAIGKDIHSHGQRNHTTSDFPFLVADVTNNRLQADYAEAPRTSTPFITSRSVTNTKQLYSTVFGDAPVLEKVGEAGEYKKGSISEGQESYKIEKYGKMIEVSEELLMNDEMGAMLKLASKMGGRAREIEEDLFWAIITSNPLMGDGKALFHADHNNLAGAGAIFSVTTVGAGRLAMRTQLGLDGKRLNISPKHLVVPAAHETAAEQFLASITPVQDSQTNPFKSLRLTSEVRLDDTSATAWFLFADKAQAEMVEVARMKGQESPQITTKMAFETDSLTMKVKHWFAAKAQDHRPFYKNPGV
tara:strand:+ start:4338 stop:6326 length:1989 start_codon:yes stop_codon:yes gene_type:complete